MEGVPIKILGRATLSWQSQPDPQNLIHASQNLSLPCSCFFLAQKDLKKWFISREKIIMITICTYTSEPTDQQHLLVQ